MYRAMGYAHAQVDHAARRLLDPRGQGTVEYVGLILLVALIMAGMVAALQKFTADDGSVLGNLIVKKIKEAVDHVKL
jgi:hypothetical protein